MKTQTVYTNGKQLFTLEDYGKNVGHCEVNGISVKGQWSVEKIRSHHYNGSVHYVFGHGDKKNLTSSNTMKRGKNLGSFKVL